MKSDRYKYDSKSRTIKQVIEKPSCYKGDESDLECSVCFEYLEQYASRRAYPAEALGLREDKELIEGTDFILKEEWKLTGRKDDYDGAMEKYKITSAHPIHPQEKQQETPPIEGKKELVIKLSALETRLFNQCGSKELKIEFGGGIGYRVSCKVKNDKWMDITDYGKW